MPAPASASAGARTPCGTSRRSARFSVVSCGVPVVRDRDRSPAGEVVLLEPALVLADEGVVLAEVPGAAEQLAVGLALADQRLAGGPLDAQLRARAAARCGGRLHLGVRRERACGRDGQAGEEGGPEQAPQGSGVSRRRFAGNCNCYGPHAAAARLRALRHEPSFRPHPSPGIRSSRLRPSSGGRVTRNRRIFRPAATRSRGSWRRSASTSSRRWCAPSAGTRSSDHTGVQREARATATRSRRSATWATTCFPRARARRCGWCCCRRAATRASAR